MSAPVAATLAAPRHAEALPPDARGGLRTFAVLWAGRLVSQVGSGLTAFALGVWVYKQSGSVTQYAALSLALALPTIVAFPFAGVLVDRWDRRRALLASEAVPALAMLALALLLLRGPLALWQILAALAAAGVVSSLQQPAFGAATTLLVPNEQRGRAAGLAQLIPAVQGIVSPILGGALVGTIGLGGVVLVDVASFAFAIATLAAVRIPRPAPAPHPRKAPGVIGEAALGWAFIRARGGLLGLLLFTAAVTFCLALANVLAVPLILGFASSAVLGTTLALGAAGLVAGSLLMGAWGGPSRRVNGMVGFAALLAAGLTIASLRPSAAWVGAGMFLVTLGVPVFSGCSQAIWQAKTPPAMQGRVFGLRLTITQSCAPLAYVVAGPLVDRVFGPLLAPGGALSGSLGRVVGTGPGRGVAALYLLLGIGALLAGMLAWTTPRLRRVEEDLADAA